MLPVAPLPDSIPPAAVEPASAPAPPEPQQGPASIHVVVVRLSDGEQLEIGTFEVGEDARARALAVVRQIASAEGEAAWPFFAGRFLRPETIVSVDLLEEPADRWVGSAVRARWAGDGR